VLAWFDANVTDSCGFQSARKRHIPRLVYQLPPLLLQLSSNVKVVSITRPCYCATIARAVVLHGLTFTRKTQIEQQYHVCVND